MKKRYGESILDQCDNNKWISDYKNYSSLLLNGFVTDLSLKLGSHVHKKVTWVYLSAATKSCRLMQNQQQQ